MSNFANGPVGFRVQLDRVEPVMAEVITRPGEYANVCKKLAAHSIKLEFLPPGESIGWCIVREAKPHETAPDSGFYEMVGSDGRSFRMRWREEAST